MKRKNATLPGQFQNLIDKLLKEIKSIPLTHIVLAWYRHCSLGPRVFLMILMQFTAVPVPSRPGFKSVYFLVLFDVQ
jgi:hypothetical protein